MSIYETDPGPKKTRKMMRIGIMAAFSGGIGVAIFLMQKIFGGMAPSTAMNTLVDDVCLMLMSYMGAIFAVFIFRRSWLIKINFILLYAIMPLILIRLFSMYM